MVITLKIFNTTSIAIVCRYVCVCKSIKYTLIHISQPYSTLNTLEECMVISNNPEVKQKKMIVKGWW